MKRSMICLSLLLSLGVAAHAAPGMGGMSSSTVSVHSSSSSSTTMSVSPISSSSTSSLPAANLNSRPSFGSNTAPAIFSQLNRGTINPNQGPSNPSQVHVASPYGYGYGGYYYGGGGYGGGGSAAEIAPQSPPGYGDGSSSAPPAADSAAIPPDGGPPVVVRQIQFIGRVTDMSGETVVLRTATHGDITLFGQHMPAGLQRGDLVVAWALPNGYWTSLTKVATPAQD